MSKITLTPSNVESAKCPADKRKFDLFDQRTKGLLLEVRATGGKTYYIRYTSTRGKVCQLKLADARDVTLAQARQLADQTRNRLAMGEDPKEAKTALRAVPTFAKFVEEDFLPHIKTYKRSWECDVSLLNNHLLPAFGSRYIDTITRRDIQKLITSRLDMGKAPGTCDRILILARHIFNSAIKWKTPGVKANPAKEVDLLKVDNKRERFLSEEEVRRLYSAVLASENPMLKYIVPMLLLTGARKREVLDARWEDFDVDNRLWRIPFTKSGRPRTVPMSDGVMSVLDTVPRIAGSPCVFPNPDTKKPYVAIHYAWDTARKRAGLKDVRMHDLRHSFASILINSGRSLYEVQHLLGHTQVKTTERYAHLQQDTLMTAANVVSNLVGTAAPQPRPVQMIGAQ
ncbi:tyrosine-type recombinase/integrase [Sphingorhabdus sp.]|jgi:integrase|uniref:tyrosine-type recombinase/integrase n=1 Tax=Sphingorhabdus sp. TaxID=1902408 RepID=UPI0037C96C96